MKDIDIYDAYFTSRRVVREDGNYYTVPLSNLHQRISAFNYLPLKILGMTKTYDNTTVPIVTHCFLTGTAIRIYGVCREEASGDINIGTWYLNGERQVSDYVTYAASKSVGYNKITGSFIRTETGSATIILMYREEF